MVDFIVVYSSFHLICAIQWCFPWGGQRAGTHTHRGQKSRLMLNARTEWTGFNHDCKQRTCIKLEWSELNVNCGKLTSFWNHSYAKYVFKKNELKTIWQETQVCKFVCEHKPNHKKRKNQPLLIFFKSHWCKNNVFIIYSYSATSTMPNLIIVW